MRRAVAAVALATLCACGSRDTTVVAQARRKVAQLDSQAVPPELGGLKVLREDMSETLKKARPSYAEATALYTLRKEDLLVATLQVSRLLARADDSSAFRRAIVNQVGGSAPKAFRMGDATVWLTTGTKQRIAVWFSDRYMFVLATRDDFDQPRALLRTALGIAP